MVDRPVFKRFFEPIVIGANASLTGDLNVTANGQVGVANQFVEQKLAFSFKSTRFTLFRRPFSSLSIGLAI